MACCEEVSIENQVEVVVCGRSSFTGLLRNVYAGKMSKNSSLKLVLLFRIVFRHRALRQVSVASVGGGLGVQYLAFNGWFKR